MAKNSVKKNYLFNVSYQMLALIVPFITTPYLSRILGPIGIGIYSYTYSIVSYFTLLAILGTSTYGIKTIGIYQDDVNSRSKEFWNIFCFRLVSSLILIIIYYVYIAVFEENKIIGYIQSIYIWAVMFDISWFFQGLEDFKKIAIRNFIIKFINIIYIFIVIKTADDLWKYVLGIAALTLVGNISVWGYLPKYIKKINVREIRPFKNLKTILQLFIPTVAIQIYSVLDKSMIGWITKQPAENGYYEQAEKIVRMSLMLITTLGTVMIPVVAKEYANKNYKKVEEALDKAFRFDLFLGIPLLCGVIGICDILVPVFFGEGFEKIKQILPILSILFVSIGINYTIGTQYLVAIGKEKIYTKNLLCGGIINFILNLILIPNYYSIGAAIASVMGEIVINILNFVYLYKNRLYNIKNILKMSYKYLFSGSIMLIITKIISYNFAENFINLFIVIGIGVVIYFGILVILKDEMVFDGIKIVKKKLRREEHG